MLKSPIAVLGAGSWGTALAILLARNGKPVRLWGHEPEHMQQLIEAGRNQRYLPTIPFPDNLSVHKTLEYALEEVNDILVVVPSYAFADVLTAIKPYLSEQTRIAWGTKGLDPKTGEFLHIAAERLLGERALAVISGPSLAKEVAEGLPTAVTVASNHSEFAMYLAHELSNKTFRAYVSADVVGVEVGGALKNIFAIAAGIIDGLQMGANALSAFITRGLAEMARLGIAVGGQPSTFMGLAGVGDLILTCTVNQSRNRKFGLAIASGMSLKQAQDQIGQAIEGLYNLKLVYQLAQRNHISTPIIEQIYKVLYENLSPQLAIETLLARDLKSEETF